MDTDRAAHLQWCKNRALEYAEIGDFDNAIASMRSDLKKHPQTDISPPIERALLISILFKPLDKPTVVKWINSFN